MKKTIFYWLFALTTIGIMGCSDSLIQEPTLPLPEPQREMTHEVTQAEARRQLEEILLDMKIPSTRGTINSVPNITSAHTTGKFTRVTRSTQEVEPYFHIFNFGDNEGFAIMSGDDRVEPLLALTYKGKLTPDKNIESPAFKIAYAKMEEYYAEQVMRGGGAPGISPILPIDSIADMPVDTTYFESKPYNQYYSTPKGYCPVTWNQGSPYNKYCFTDSGAPAPTGCVATAVAQFMAMYKYPESYNGFTFNWDAMIDSTHTNATINSPVTDRLAMLMFQLGVDQNLDMNYGIYSSGANPENIPRTFENMGYKQGGRLVTYKTSQVSANLKLRGPVLVGGRNNLDEGHRWLAHGLIERKVHVTAYLENSLVPVRTFERVEATYILCNMGWGGSADGYYLSECFDTDEGPDYQYNTTRTRVGDGNFSSEITAIIGVIK